MDRIKSNGNEDIKVYGLKLKNINNQEKLKKVKFQ